MGNPFFSIFGGVGAGGDIIVAVVVRGTAEGTVVDDIVSSDIARHAKIMSPKTMGCELK